MIHGDKTNYDAIAEKYLDGFAAKSILTHYERPYMLSKIPNVSGKTVLDLGCASGFYSKYCIDRGARVISVDASKKMIEHTVRLCNGANEAHVHDIAAPFTFANDESIDFVICSLVLHYIEHWDPVLAELHRVLRLGGRCVISTHHPVNDYIHFGEGRYFETRLIDDTWNRRADPVSVKYFVRPLSACLRPLIDSDFDIISIEEPMPDPALKEIDADLYAGLSHDPTFLFAIIAK